MYAISIIGLILAFGIYSPKRWRNVSGAEVDSRNDEIAKIRISGENLTLGILSQKGGWICNQFFTSLPSLRRSILRLDKCGNVARFIAAFSVLVLALKQTAEEFIRKTAQSGDCVVNKGYELAEVASEFKWFDPIIIGWITFTIIFIFILIAADLSIGYKWTNITARRLPKDI